MYTVRVNDVPAVYQSGYFPRKFKYKTEAVRCAETAVELGATFARVECEEDGTEIDVRPVKKG